MADLGCGTGRLTAHLVAAGLDVVEVDLSPGMLAVARREHPDVPSTVGSLAETGLDAGSLTGALVAFQVGEDQPVHRDVAYEHPVPLDSCRLFVAGVTTRLQAA